jgi:hypothetical protein
MIWQESGMSVCHSFFDWSFWSDFRLVSEFLSLIFNPGSFQTIRLHLDGSCSPPDLKDCKNNVLLVQADPNYIQHIFSSLDFLIDSWRSDFGYESFHENGMMISTSDEVSCKLVVCAFSFIGDVSQFQGIVHFPFQLTRTLNAFRINCANYAKIWTRISFISQEEKFIRIYAWPSARMRRFSLMMVSQCF